MADIGAVPEPASSLSVFPCKIGLFSLSCFTNSGGIATHYLIGLVGKEAKEQSLMNVTCASTKILVKTKHGGAQCYFAGG